MSDMQATLTWVHDMQFVGRSGRSPAVVLDGHDSAGGPSPMELVLLGAAGCSAMDVVSILRKKRSPLTGLEVHIRGEQAEEYPKSYTSFHIEYVVHGQGVKRSDVERAIELSITKYCSVLSSLKAPATTSIRMEPE